MRGRQLVVHLIDDGGKGRNLFTIATWMLMKLAKSLILQRMNTLKIHFSMNSNTPITSSLPHPITSSHYIIITSSYYLVTLPYHYIITLHHHYIITTSPECAAQ